MKTKTWILILSVILAVCAVCSILFLRSGDPALQARITSQGKVIRIVDLRIDQEFTISAPDGGFNVVTVRDGAIAVTEASCPDHYCMHRGFCDSGAQIVCLPNRLVIEFLNEQDIDIAVG